MISIPDITIFSSFTKGLILISAVANLVSKLVPGRIKFGPRNDRYVYKNFQNIK